MRCAHSFTGQDVISLKPNNACKKQLCLALEWVKNCPSRVLFVTFGSSAGQILVQVLTKFDCP